MKALVSGEAAASVVLAKRPELRRLDQEQIVGWPVHEIARCFDGCRDLEFVEVQSAADAIRRTELAWAQDRGLRLFLFLVDPGEPEAEL